MHILLLILLLALPSFAMDELKDKNYADLFSPALPYVEIYANTAPRVWEMYTDAVKEDKKRLSEHKKKEIRYNKKIMKYASKKVGEKDANGYPLYIALHGGGGSPARVNNSQYEHMKVYYLNSVKKGIYVAPRGVTNTWNLHTVKESYALYDRLIENMILFEDVDPNRVYIMGFSAGGDGTYQLAPRMTDRWAAASMSAGHPNGISPRNLYNLPFLIQVGAYDKAYKRHHEAVKYGQRIMAHQQQEKGGYPHQVNIHFGRGHNFLDNHSKEIPQKIMVKPVEWMKTGRSAIKNENTNAIRWLSKHVRNPLPKRIVWDLKTRAPRSALGLWTSPARGNRFYWLGYDKKSDKEVIASYAPKSNTVKIEKAIDGLRVYLNQKMLNLKVPVLFDIEGQQLKLTINASIRNLAITARERGDENYLFEGLVIITKKDNKWSALSEIAE